MAEEKVELKLVASSDPSDVFNDLAALRRESKLTVKRKTVLTNVTVGKPANNVFFRVSDDPEKILENATILKHKEGSKEIFYFVVPAMRAHPKLEPRLQAVSIRLVTTWPGSNVQLWPVALSDSFPAWRSAQQAAQLAQQTWVQIAWNEERGDYNVETAENINQEPIWPTETFAQLLKVAFADRIIDNEDHEYVRRLRGLTE
jgi:hypothetical protein